MEKTIKQTYICCNYIFSLNPKSNSAVVYAKESRKRAKSLKKKKPSKILRLCLQLRLRALWRSYPRLMTEKKKCLFWNQSMIQEDFHQDLIGIIVKLKRLIKVTKLSLIFSSDYLSPKSYCSIFK